MFRPNGYTHEYDLIEVSPYDHIKIDDKVYVSDFTITKEAVKGCRKGYFAGLSSSGKPLIFDRGATSWSQTARSSWNYCVLASETDND
jgi:hypothetical protein